MQQLSQLHCLWVKKNANKLLKHLYISNEYLYNVESIAADEEGTKANNHNKYTWQEKIFGT